MKDVTISKGTYMGVNSYEEENCEFFKGRNKEIWQLFDRIIRNEITVYYAETGEGKSSLIKSGLFPLIRKRDFFPVYITLQDADFDNQFNILEKIQDAVTNWNSKHKGEEVEYVVSGTNVMSINEAFENEWFGLRCCCIKQKHGNSEKELTPLIVFDQFEEIFTKGSYDWIDSLINKIGYISSPDTENLTDGQKNVLNKALDNHFRLLFSLRTEWLGDLDYWCAQKHFIPGLQDNRLCLKALTPSGAKEVIGLSSELNKYETSILKGCAKEGEDITQGDWPCVYALVLSVICAFLCEEQNKEDLLNKLQDNPGGTVDYILHNFYLTSLKTVSISTDTEIELFSNAFVDESGRRRRRNLGEKELSPFRDKIENENNGLVKLGLIKTQGWTKANEDSGTKKDEDKHLIVELPHDRMCKAINTYRQERRKEIERKNIRLKEWMQFGIISVVLGIIATCMCIFATVDESIMTPLVGLLSSDSNKVGEQFKIYLDNNPTAVKVGLVELLLDESFSTILLIGLCALFFPLIIHSSYRNSKCGKWFSLIISLIGVACFGWLWWRNSNIYNLNSYVSWLTIIATIICGIVVAYKVLQLKKQKLGNHENTNYSLWPLLGGYCLFTIVIFLLCLFNQSMGAPIPGDSYWALIALPLLTCAFTWSFFNLHYCRKNIELGKHTVNVFAVISIICIIALSLGCGAILYPYYFHATAPIVTYTWAVLLMFFAILSWMMSSKPLLWHGVIGFLGNVIVLLAVGVLILGYNFINIAPSSVISVCTWNTVEVKKSKNKLETRKDYLNETFGILSWDGDTIIPCRIEVQSIEDSCKKDTVSIINLNGMVKVKSSVEFYENPIKSLPIFDRVFEYSNKHVYGYFLSDPALERYLRNIKNTGLMKNMSLQDSIIYYSVNLFDEIRKANLDYVGVGKRYTMSDLDSYKHLKTLQYKAWKKECRSLKSKISKFTDNDLVGFHRELTRRFMLLQLKDIVEKEDYPNVFALIRLYPIAFFGKIKARNVNLNLTINPGSINITDKDVFEEKLFAWYYLFHNLCCMDMNFNEHFYVENIQIFGDELYRCFENYNKNRNKLINELGKLSKKPQKSIEDITDVFRKLSSNKDAHIREIEELKEKYKKKHEDFEQLKKEVFECFDPYLSSPYHIHNNAFETIYKDLIKVSVLRDLGIEEDTLNLDSWKRIKEAGYDSILHVTQKRDSLMDEAVNILKSSPF